MATAFSEIQDLVDGKLNETPDATKRNAAINGAVMSLWKKLCEVDPETYLSQKPETLALDADIVPFEDLEPNDFIECASASELYGGLYEYDAAGYWDGKAREALHEILVLAVRNMKRQDKVTYYQAQYFGNVRWPNN